MKNGHTTRVVAPVVNLDVFFVHTTYTCCATTTWQEFQPGFAWQGGVEPSRKLTNSRKWYEIHTSTKKLTVSDTFLRDSKSCLLLLVVERKLNLFHMCVSQGCQQM